jgi:two-component system, cell cycle response regulator CtrA
MFCQPTELAAMMILRVGETHPLVPGSFEETMRTHGIRSECVATGREALEFLRLYDYDLVLMDLRLSDGQAHQIVRAMRAALHKVPVLVVSDTAAPLEAKVKVLDQGADDFLATPCDIRELMARIRAVVRRSQGHTKSALTLGPVELWLDRREVLVHGTSLHLSRREYAILELLFLRQGTVLNKDAFLNHLYCGGDEPEMKTIDVIICRLRKKLAVAGVPKLIDTVWGCGYILRDPSPAGAVGNDEPRAAPAWLDRAQATIAA